MSSANQRRLARRASERPLVITARLRCGIISDGFLPIDSVLYYAAHRDLFPGEQVSTHPRALTVRAEGDTRIVGPLPLKRLNGQAPDWYYAASCAQWPSVVADGIDHWTKRVDSRYVELLAEQRARISMSGGRYRAYRMPLVYRHALTVHWHVVGDREAVTRLLELVTHLGKKPSMGWGAVMEWVVEPCAEDWSVTGRDGQLMRPVPHAAGLLYGIRPPYWLPSHQVPCALPSGSGLTPCC